MVGVALSLPGEKDAGQRLSTQYQRLTPCPPSQHRAALNKAGYRVPRGFDATTFESTVAAVDELVRLLRETSPGCAPA